MNLWLETAQLDSANQLIKLKPLAESSLLTDMTPRFFSITVVTDLATTQVDCIVIRDNNGKPHLSGVRAF